MKRGVAGFRLDAIPTLYEDPQLRDEKPVLDENGKPKINAYGDVALDDRRHDRQPAPGARCEEELRAVTFNDDIPARVLIGETYFRNIADLRRMLRHQERRVAAAHGLSR